MLAIWILSKNCQPFIYRVVGNIVIRLRIKILFFNSLLQLFDIECFINSYKEHFLTEECFCSFLVILFIYYKTMFLTNCRYVYEILSLEFNIRSLERHPNRMNITKLFISTESNEFSFLWIHDALHIMFSIRIV